MTEEPNSLMRLTAAHVKPAAVTAARAFHEYPLVVYFIPDASKRFKKQAVSFEELIQSGIEYGEVYATSSEMEGIAVWFYSDIPYQRRQPLIRRWYTSLFADKAQIRRQRAFGEYAGAVRKRVVPGKHLYLQLLGVAPAYQGKGYSSRLLKPMLARADREGLPCFLETQAAKNVTLYEHFGFKAAEEGIIPGSDVHSWAMVREPVKL